MIERPPDDSLRPVKIAENLGYVDKEVLTKIFNERLKDFPFRWSSKQSESLRELEQIKRQLSDVGEPFSEELDLRMYTDHVWTPFGWFKVLAFDEIFIENKAVVAIVSRYTHEF